MADIESNIIMQDKGLDVYSVDDAKSLVITKTDKISQYNEHKYWEFEVTDLKGNTFMWKDFALPDTATKEEVKAQIFEYCYQNIPKLNYNVALQNLSNSNQKVRAIITDKGLDETVY